MDFGYVGEQLTFVTRSRDFLIGCMFVFFFFYSSAHAIHPLFDSRLLIDCQWFSKLQGKVTGKASVANKQQPFEISFRSMARNKVLLKKAGQEFLKVGVQMIKFSAPVEFQWISTCTCTKRLTCPEHELQEKCTNS